MARRGVDLQRSDPEPLMSSVNYLMMGMSADGQRGRFTYAVQALLHPLNLFAALMAVAIGLISGSLWMLPATACAEVIMLATLPKSKLFRRSVDQRLMEFERAEAARARELLLVQMSEMHRQELERIEYLVDAIRHNAARHGGAVRFLLDEQLDLSRLVASYVRLAIAHKERTALLAMTDRTHLDREIDRLEKDKGRAKSASLRALLEQRLSIVRKRAEHWDRTRSNLEAISHQLGIIAEVVQLLHAQSVTPFGSEETSEELDRFMQELDESESTLKELSEIDTEELQAFHPASPEPVEQVVAQVS
jgi:hypothetical protein